MEDVETDVQFKLHLREMIADLERIIRMGVNSEAEAEIEALIDRLRISLQD